MEGRGVFVDVKKRKEEKEENYQEYCQRREQEEKVKKEKEKLKKEKEKKDKEKNEEKFEKDFGIEVIKQENRKAEAASLSSTVESCKKKLGSKLASDGKYK